MTVPLCIRQGSKINEDWVSVEELDWSAESQVLIPAEHLWCEFKCRHWAKDSSLNLSRVSVIQGSHMCCACLWDMRIWWVCLKEQNKLNFLILAKENKFPLGLYQSPPTFFFTNLGFVLQIHNRCFFFFLSLHSSLITQRRNRMSSTRNNVQVWQITEVREKCLLHFKYVYVSYKNV